MILRIAIQYMTNRKRQAAISVTGVMLGVAFFIGIASMMQGMHDYFIARLINTAPHVKIVDEYRMAAPQPVEKSFPDDLVLIHGIKPKTETRGIRNAGIIIDQLQALQGVRVSPSLTGQAFLRYGGKDVSTVINGIDPLFEKHTSNLANDMTEGRLESLLTNANGIILGSTLAEKLGVKTGDRVNAVSPVGNIRQMKIVGIFESGVTEVDGARSYALLKKVQILQGKEDTVNQINLRMTDVDAAPALALELERRYRYKAESWQETFSNIFELFVIQDSIMYSTVAAILIVAGFGIYNIISNTVREKSRDIAILKSMGFSERDIVLIFFTQGIIIGLTGAILGWALGALIIEGLSSIRLHLAGQIPIKLTGFPMFRSFWLYIAGGSMAVLSAAISSYLPARKAALLDPVDIIRGAGS